MSSSSKKRKPDQDYELSLKPQLTSIECIRQPDSDPFASVPAPVLSSDFDVDLHAHLPTFESSKLLSLLGAGASRDPITMLSLHTFFKSDPSQCKLFVHDLDCNTTSASLNQNFSRYGPIQSCYIVSDKATKRSKGYSFVIFKDRSSSLAALPHPIKIMDNRVTICQFASTGRFGTRTTTNNKTDEG